MAPSSIEERKSKKKINVLIYLSNSNENPKKTFFYSFILNIPLICLINALRNDAQLTTNHQNIDQLMLVEIPFLEAAVLYHFQKTI